MIDKFSRKIFFLLLFYLFLESVTEGFILPLIGPLFYDKTHSIFDVNVSSSFRQELFGLMVLSTALVSLISLPFLGSLYDRYGRKKLLAMGGFLMFSGYFLSGLSVIYKQYVFLLTGELIIALSVGTSACAIASIIDISNEETKPFNLRWVNIVGSIGLLAGPLVGGYFSDESFLGLPSYAFPFFLVSFINFINFIVIVIFLRQGDVKNTDKMSEKIFMKIFRLFEKSGYYLLGVFFVILLVTISYLTLLNYTSIFLVKFHGFTSKNIAILMVVIIVGYSLTLYLMYPSLLARYGQSNLLRAALITSSLLLFSVLFFLKSLLFVVFVFFIMLVNGIQNNLLMLLFTDLVDEKIQGLGVGILGMTGAAGAMISGGIFILCSSAPYYILFFISFLFTLLATILFITVVPYKAD